MFLLRDDPPANPTITGYSTPMSNTPEAFSKLMTRIIDRADAHATAINSLQAQIDALQKWNSALAVSVLLMFCVIAVFLFKK